MFPKPAAAPLALLATSAVTLVAAQTTLTDVIAIPGFEGPNEASVVSAGASATVLVINCPTGTAGDDCGFGPGITATVGPSTWGWGISSSSEGVSVTEGFDCSLDRSADTAVCTAFGTGSVDATATVELMTTGTFTTTGTVSSISQFVYAVTVTGGLDKLAAATTATGTSVTKTGSSGATATGTGASASSTTTAVKGSGAVSLKAGGVWMGVLGAAVAALL